MLVHEIINRGQEKDTAIVEGERHITYAQARVGVKKFRNHLYNIGVRQGDRVAILSRNSAEFIYAYLAIASLGAICVPINFQLSAREIDFILQNAGVKYLLTYEFLALGKSVNQYDIKTFSKNEFPQAPQLSSDFNENLPCAIIYTSGTTGSPKGAILSHKNLVHNTKQITILNCQSKNKVLCVLPMYHCFGWTCCVLYTLYCGAQIHIIRTFAPKEVVETIRENQITDFYAVPSIYRLITKIAKSNDLKSLRLAMCSGTTLPLKISQEFTEKFGIVISEGYGLSEASPIVTLSLPKFERVGSIGKAIPDEEIKVVDENGKSLPTGENGELLIRGDNVMIGYWKDPEATRRAIDEAGWLHTGDIVKMDADGYFYIVNRIKEMIISMGENIYPREVEEIIYRFEGIKDAAVIGVEDKLRGQTGACFFVSQENFKVDIRSLKKFLQKNLAHYKIPREFYELKKLPRTSTGKISKKDLLKNYIAMKI